MKSHGKLANLLSRLFINADAMEDGWTPENGEDQTEDPAHLDRELRDVFSQDTLQVLLLIPAPTPFDFACVVDAQS